MWKICKASIKVKTTETGFRKTYTQMNRLTARNTVILVEMIVKHLAENSSIFTEPTSLFLIYTRFSNWTVS